MCRRASSVQTETVSESRRRSVLSWFRSQESLAVHLTRFRGSVISHQEEFLHAVLAKPISFSGTAVYFFMRVLIKPPRFHGCFCFPLIFFPQKLILFCLFLFVWSLPVKFWSSFAVVGLEKWNGCSWLDPVTQGKVPGRVLRREIWERQALWFPQGIPLVWYFMFWSCS